MSACETTSRGQSVALGFATADIKEEGWVVQFAGREKKKKPLELEFLKNTAKVGHLQLSLFTTSFFKLGNGRGPT